MANKQLTNSWETIDALPAAVTNITTAVTNITTDVDAIRNLPVTAVVSDEWDINVNSRRAYQTQITSDNATAKTLTVSGTPTAEYIAIGVRLVVTTACAITYTNITFAEGAPTVADGDVWLLALESVDNGASYNALATQIVKGS